MKKTNIFKIEFPFIFTRIIIGLEFFLLAGLLGQSRLNNLPAFLIWLLVVLVSVLVHELGHAAAFHSYGIPSSIRLHYMGGMTIPESSHALSHKQNILVTLAGPLAGLTLGLFALLININFNFNPYLNLLLNDLIIVNFAWSIFNLLPVFPMDGGQILERLLALKFKSQAYKISGIISIVFAAGLIALSIIYNNIYLIFLLGYLLYQNILRLKNNQAIANPEEQKKIKEIEDHFKNSSFSESYEVSLQLRNATNNKDVKKVASTYAVCSLIQTGQLTEASQLVEKFESEVDAYICAYVYFSIKEFQKSRDFALKAFYAEPGDKTGQLVLSILKELQDVEKIFSVLLSPQGLNLGDSCLAIGELALFENKEYDKALQISKMRRDMHQSPEGAYNGACSEMKLGNHEAAVHWLKEAVNLGYNNKEALEEDEDFAALRDNSEFQRLIDQITQN